MAAVDFKNRKYTLTVRNCFSAARAPGASPAVLTWLILCAHHKPKMKYRTIWMFLLLIVLIFLSFYLRADGNPWDWMDKRFRVIALYLAFFIFLYKFIAGWTLINLKVKLDSIRINKDSFHDDLVVTVNLEKGTTDSLSLRMCSGIIFWYYPEFVESSVEYLLKAARQQKKKRYIHSLWQFFWRS